jgi:Co/Zn/Cd efflux system component
MAFLRLSYSLVAASVGGHLGLILDTLGPTLKWVALFLADLLHLRTSWDLLGPILGYVFPVLSFLEAMLRIMLCRFKAIVCLARMMATQHTAHT